MLKVFLFDGYCSFCLMTITGQYSETAVGLLLPPSKIPPPLATSEGDTLHTMLLLLLHSKLMYWQSHVPLVDFM